MKNADMKYSRPCWFNTRYFLFGLFFGTTIVFVMLKKLPETFGLKTLKDVENMRQLHITMTGQKEKCEADLSNANNKLAEQAKKESELSAKLQGCESSKATLQKDLDTVKAEKQPLVDKNNELEAAKKTFETKAGESLKTIEDLSSQIKSLNTQIKAEKEMTLSLKTELEKLKVKPETGKAAEKAKTD